MGSITHNLRLNVPDFDAMPWDVDVNTNWLVLDATVGMFAAIPNLVGAWKNATAYSYGQSVIDPTDSGIWSCIQAHTSTAAPQSFLQERIAYPGRWAQTTQGAQFYAQQAAASASSAQAAADAAEAAAAVAGTALQLTGGTMSGYIVLHADPVSPMQAVTQQYVDARVGGTGYLPITGGTLTGGLAVGGNGITYNNVTDVDRHAFSFGWTGTSAYIDVDGVWIGTLATREYVNGAYLPLTGGSLSGTLYTAGELSTNATFRIVSSQAYFSSTAAATSLVFDSANWGLQYNRSTGTLTYIRGGDGLSLWYVDGSGNSLVRGTLNAVGSVAAGSNLYARGGNVFWGAGDRSRLSSDNASYTTVEMLDQYKWHLNWSTGTLAWYRYDSAPVFTLDFNGTANFSGHVHAGPNGMLLAVGNSMWFGLSGANRVWQMADSWYWFWDASNGNLSWRTGAGSFFSLLITSSRVGNDIGPVYGVGAYINNSDERSKTDIAPSTYGLDDIMKLEPIVFRRLKAIDDREEHGFSAQQVQKVIPHAVWDIDADGERIGVTLDPIVVALVNGMKQMNERIQQLESK